MTPDSSTQPDECRAAFEQWVPTVNQAEIRWIGHSYANAFMAAQWEGFRAAWNARTAEHALSQVDRLQAQIDADSTTASDEPAQEPPANPYDIFNRSIVRFYHAMETHTQKGHYEIELMMLSEDYRRFRAALRGEGSP